MVNEKRMHFAQNICVILLFLLFTVSTLLLVVVSINSYYKITNKAEDNSELRSTLSYVTNKLRTLDENSQLMVCEVNGTSCLEIASTIEGRQYINYVYVNNYQLCEQLLLASDKPDFENGSFITQIKSFSVQKGKNGLFKITAVTKNGLKSDTEVFVPDFSR